MDWTPDFWALSGGETEEWRAALDARARRALEDLRGLASAGAVPRLRFFLERDHPARRRLLLFPALDHWLFRARGGAEPEEHLAAFQSFAAALALETGAPLKLRVRLGPGGRFHATGRREWLTFPRAKAGEVVEVSVRKGRLSGPGARLALLPELAPGVWVDFRDPLILEPVRVHPPAAPTPAQEKAYARVLRHALGEIARLDPGLHAELSGFIRVLIPLENPKKYGSVSSSYQSMRGALGLSHSEDSLLQQETLIHEFCHQKANLLSELDPLILPGQGGQVFYSPLRPDARRLRGLLLGAHAFVNVNRYLLRALDADAVPRRARDSVARNICRRAWHVEDMLRSVSGYASLTALGQGFLLRLWREAMLHHHAVLAFPKSLVDEARAKHREHRARYALGDTGIFQPAKEAA